MAPFSPKAFRLLEILSERRPNAVSKEVLYRLLWPNTFVSDRVVDNHIGSLRKKIEPDASEPRYLLNVRGLGYRFVCE